MKGGCACGSIRYRLEAEPYDTGWCHCRVCQKTSGAPAIVFTTVPRDAMVVETGNLSRYQSTEHGERGFCGDCGTLLTIQVSFQPDEIDIAVATLDKSDRVQPGFHIFYGERIGWAAAGDDLPRHEGWRPQTRGLG